MKLAELIDFLHGIAPIHYQESYDNSGHLVGNENDEIKAVLISLDVTESVLDEAISLGANLVISHHPIIFSGLKNLTGQTYVQRIVQKAIKNDINLFAIHTNLDNVYFNGVNTYLAKVLDLKNIEILKPKENITGTEQAIGSGAIGILESPVSEMEFLSALKAKLKLDCIKYTSLLNKKISKVALCGGSGRFLLSDAIQQNADIFISSDFKYHEFFDADNQIVIADIGHFESEQHTIKMIHEILTNKFNNFASHYTKVNTNPVNYLIDNG
jgi:dinuclear metal center YbgI/SA1388 family protein